jgi:hypothetical protein
MTRCCRSQRWRCSWATSRDVARPALGGVEADYADRVFVLPLEHVHDDRFKDGALDSGFAVGAAVAAEVVQDDVDVLVIVPERSKASSRNYASQHSTLTDVESSSGIQANRSGFMEQAD